MAHSFPFTLTWTGTTADAAYTRDAVITKEGATPLPVSSAPQYAGTPERWNPEDMLGSALATCHMLTFLALAAKSRIEVTHYEDKAEAILDTVDKVTRIVAVRLSPVIRVPRGTDAAKVVELFEKAHKYCFIANSVSCEAILEPRVVEA